MDININSQVFSYANLAAFPGTGAAKTLYVAADTNYIYYWDGAAYQSLGASGAAWGSITGTLSNQTDLQSALDAKQNSLGYTAEDSANKSTNVVTDQASNTKYPSVKAVYDWAVGAFQAVGSYITASSVDTLTNKTFDADGTGNSITNIENADIKSGAAIDATKIADGSVSNTEFQYLDGVTSAIQTQLNAKSKILAKSTTTYSHTGDNTNTQVFSVLLSANTIAVGDIFEIQSRCTKVGTAGSLTQRWYFNTTDDLSGATLLLTQTGAASTLNLGIRRNAYLKSASDLSIVSTTTSIPDDVGSAITVYPSSLSIDFTGALYLICALQLTNGADTGELNGFFIEKR